MNTNRTLALALVAVGLLLIIAGPLLPGGERAVVNDPPRTGHVTDLARADDGTILAGTQDGELWRLADGVWGAGERRPGRRTGHRPGGGSVRRPERGPHRHRRRSDQRTERPAAGDGAYQR